MEVEIQTPYLSKVSDNDLLIGSMRIAKPKFKALLIFTKNDDQCQAWKECFEFLGFLYHVTSSEQAALDEFKKHQHHLIVIEDQSETIDPKQLCRSLRQTYIGNFTTIAAIISKRVEKDGTSTARTLLTAGFNQLINATSNRKEIEDVLLQLEAGPLTLQLKFRSCQAVFTALERSRDLIEIADENFQIQYVNNTYEQVTGYLAKEVLGQNLSFQFENEKNEEDAWQRIKEEIVLGKEWEGFLYMKQKEADDFHANVVMLPLTGQDGTVHQYVIVSRTLANSLDTAATRRKNSYELHRKQSGTPEPMLTRRSSATSTPDGDGSYKRANSLARVHSMAVEAPITQIIHLISVIKESSQPSVSEVLHQILDILRNSELYAPADLPNRTRDPMLSDFVEGLVTGTAFSHRRPSGGSGDNVLGRSPPSIGIKPPHSGSQSPTVTVIDPMIAACLHGSDSWNYDVLALERITAKKPLVHLGMQILNEYNACELLNCTPTTLHSWLVAIESQYHSSNPYHNSTHAADVLHATAYFLRKERVKTWMETTDEIASLLAAIVHDVDHPGRTNAFLINSNNPLALLYNDTAVLESHHAAFAFNLTVSSESCNIFKHLSQDSFRSLRQSMIDMVLATELSKHFEHVNKFISVVTKSNNSNEQQDVTLSGNSRSSGSVNPAINHELKVLIRRIMIKVADVINPARKTSLCIEWARRISEEYFSQTDEEKSLGLPVVMPHFDRTTCSLPKSQVTFIDYFLTDMCEAWHEFCGMSEVMENLNNNYNYWFSLQEKGVMKLEEISNDLGSAASGDCDGSADGPEPKLVNSVASAAQNRTS